jgi:hypothetical protein
MNSGARLGLAITAAYLLGRFHKLKWALGLAALAGRGRLPGGQGLFEQGAKLLASSPEFTRLTEEMRGRLVDAGKAAAVAAVSSKVDSLSESLRERTEAMRAASAGSEGGGAVGEEEDGEEERHRDKEERYRDESRTAESRRKRHPDKDDGGHVPAPRRPASRAESERTRGGGQSRSREDLPADGRAGHPSRHTGDGEDARGGVGARQGEDGGRSGPRSSASRTGDDTE